jgi:NAD(P)-dependent dehydrogenase (short-subunit alcohol dehydrogenase family)
MSEDFRERVTHHPPPSLLGRMRGSMFGQSAASPRCPQTPRLDGRVALVTGGMRGIGLETSRGLAARGAEVIAASRSASSGKPVVEVMRAELGRPAHFVALDLADLASVGPALDEIASKLAGRRLDVLIANAGLWPLRYATSAQGHEIAFATNVLGHHALIRGAIRRGLLAEGARVVAVTGDIYIMASECTPDFRYRGMLGGQLAYCRSKLGNLWLAQELARRQASLRVHAVHPGVIASGLGGGGTGLGAAIKRALMISLEQGAQTSLFCATQPGLASGSYYHNVLGRVELDPRDPAADRVKAAALWDLVEALVETPRDGEDAR